MKSYLNSSSMVGGVNCQTSPIDSGSSLSNLLINSAGCYHGQVLMNGFMVYKPLCPLLSFVVKCLTVKHIYTLYIANIGLSIQKLG